MEKKTIFSKQYIAVLLCTIAAVVAFFVMKPAKKSFFKAAGEVWTTEYHITYEATADLSDSIAAVLEMVDRSANVFNKQSLISRLNSGSTNRADSLFMRMMACATEVNKASAGAYDPTVMPLVNAWGFGYKNGQLPTKEQIDSILAFVGLQKVHLEDELVKKDDHRIQFDFSSIAKGLACDEVARMLARNGVDNCMVEIGGEVATRGVNEQGTPWNISIDMPIENAQATIHESALVIALSGKAVATSGNYRKYKNVAGKKVSHIVNPITGYSEESTLLSATVVAPDCMSADAWATACMAMGTERTHKMMESRTDLAVMTISTDASGNFIAWSNKPFTTLLAK
ncbi:MAG: FAD:protein FMN transferase [Bacteroidales bacterium]|nr:FAD:protein FMN transferase [Bacteroidales bacterium]